MVEKPPPALNSVVSHEEVGVMLEKVGEEPAAAGTDARSGAAAVNPGLLR